MAIRAGGGGRCRLQDLDGSGDLQQAGTTLQPIVLVAIRVMLKSIRSPGHATRQQCSAEPQSGQPIHASDANAALGRLAGSRPFYRASARRRLSLGNVLRDTESNRWSSAADCSGTMLVWLLVRARIDRRCPSGVYSGWVANLSRSCSKRATCRR